MNYSHSHQRFAKWLNEYHEIDKLDALEHPENYLGPNYKELLNWWFYWESLSVEQWDVFWDRWDSLCGETRKKLNDTIRAHIAAKKLATEFINPEFVDYFFTEN